MLAIVNLDESRCKDYLINKIDKWGYFGHEIAQNNILDDGNFFCIAPADTKEELLHQFDFGGQVFPRGKIERHDGYAMEEVTNYGEEVFLSFAERYLNTKKASRFLIMEDFLSSPNDPFIEEQKVDFYMADSTVVYLVDNAPDRDKLEEYYYLANDFHFMPFFSDCELGNLVSKEKIDAQSLKNIVNNIKVLFFQIYDGESCLIWVKNEESELLGILSQCINKS